MYSKDLKKDIRFRVSDRDFSFLESLANERGQSISELCRYIIGEYRRSVETMNLLNKALELSRGNDNNDIEANEYDII